MLAALLNSIICENPLARLRKVQTNVKGSEDAVNEGGAGKAPAKESGGGNASKAKAPVVDHVRGNGRILQFK